MRHLADDVRPTRALALHGALWAVWGGALRYAIAGVTMLALTHLLEPGDFGLIAIAAAAQALIEHIATVGVYDALIQRPRLESSDLDSAFWSMMAVCGMLTLLVLLLAAPVAGWFHEPRLGPLIAAMAAVSLIRPLGIVPRALMARRLDFRTPMLARVTAMVFAGSAAVILAILGAGPWSLLAQVAVFNTVSTALVWCAEGWSPGRRVSRAITRRLWGFAASVSIFTVVAYAIQHADDQLIGYRLGAEPLGYYALAYAFMAWPTHDILGGVAVVLYPVFTRLQDDLPRLQTTYLHVVQIIAAAAFPFLVLLAITAPVLVPWLLGNRWTPAVLPVQILALGGLRESTGMLNGQVYRALGKPQIHMWWALSNLGCYLAAYVVGVNWGISGVAFFAVLVGYVLYPVSIWLVLGVAGIPWWRWVGVLVPVGIAVVGLGGVSLVLWCVARSLWDVPVVVLGLTVGGGGVVYGGLLFVQKPVGLVYLWDGLAGVVRGRLPGK